MCFRRFAPATGALLALHLQFAPRLLAHSGPPPAPGTLLRSWNTDPWVVLPLALLGLLYLRGVRALWGRAGPGRGIRRWEAGCFAAGHAALFVALVSPLDAWGASLFSAHMAQHMMLIAVAAPLLVLGRPPVPLLWALPIAWRRAVGTLGRSAPIRRGWRWLTAPIGVWVLHTLAIWVWHAPGLYQATLRSETVHLSQHLSFFGTAVLFWWVLLRLSARRGWGPGIGVVFVFTTALHSGILGALITFSPGAWYPAYEITAWWWGLTLLEDQQLGGLIMWIPGGIIYLLAALGLLAIWLGATGAASARPRSADPA